MKIKDAYFFFRENGSLSNLTQNENVEYMQICPFGVWTTLSISTQREEKGIPKIMLPGHFIVQWKFSDLSGVKLFIKTSLISLVTSNVIMVIHINQWNEKKNTIETNFTILNKLLSLSLYSWCEYMNNLDSFLSIIPWILMIEVW